MTWSVDIMYSTAVQNQLYMYKLYSRIYYRCTETVIYHQLSKVQYSTGVQNRISLTWSQLQPVLAVTLSARLFSQPKSNSGVEGLQLLSFQPNFFIVYGAIFYLAWWRIALVIFRPPSTFILCRLYLNLKILKFLQRMTMPLILFDGST